MEVNRCFERSSENVRFGRKTSFYDCEDCHHVWNGRKPTTSLRIRLSYGHNSSEELARRLKADLENGGHHVWFDKAEIKIDRDWLELSIPSPPRSVPSPIRREREQRGEPTVNFKGSMLQIDRASQAFTLNTSPLPRPSL
jgi:hypothetical protein